MTIAEVALWANAVAAAVAVPTAFARPHLRAISALVILNVPATLFRSAFRERLLLPFQEAVRAAGGEPFGALTGWMRALFHLSQGIFLAWSLGVVVVAAIAFGLRRPWLLLAPYLLALLVLVLGYRHFAGHAVRDVVVLYEVAMTFVGWGIAAAWVSRRRSPAAQHVAALTILAFQGAYLLGYANGPWRTWDVARIALIGLFGGVSLIQVGSLCWTDRSSSASS